jgi:hypothetical protein
MELNTLIYSLTDNHLAFLSVLIATIITMVTVGVESKGWVPNEVTTTVSFREGFLAVTNIIFAYRMLTSHETSTMVESRANLVYSRPCCILRLHV